MEKVLIQRIYVLVMIVSYISASDFCNKWVQDLDFENNLDTSQLLWDKDDISSRITCGILCNSNPSFRSFFYHPSLKKCMGSQSYKRGLPSGQSMQLGWEYYTKSQQCDGYYTFNKTLGLCFKIHPEIKTYQEAMDACEAEEAKLIIIRNELEFVQVRNALKAAGPLTSPFNGLRKTFSNGIATWKWWNGQIPSYLEWEPGQPNNYGGDQNCAFFANGAGYQCDFSNKWMLDHDFENNLDTSQLLWDKEGISSLITCGSLCNSDPSCRSFFYHPSLKKCMGSQSYKRGLPSGLSMQLGWKYYTKSQECDGDYTFNKTLGLCFKIHPETKTYLEAMDACEAEGAKLIIIRNEMEFAHARNALKAAGPLTYALNGLRKTLSNGIITWKWWNGQIPSYMDWEPGQPDNYGGDEDCENFFTVAGHQYKFDDVDFFWRNSFICQKNI